MFRHAQICLLVVTSLFVLSACATASLPSQMAASPNTTPTATSSEPGYHQMRVVQVQGGRKTSPLGESDVSNSDFKAALVRILNASNLDQLLEDVPRERRLDTLCKLAEYVFPKQSRQEVVGDGGGPLTIEIVKYCEVSGVDVVLTKIAGSSK